MGKYWDILKYSWNQGAEKGKAMKEADKKFVKSIVKKKGDKK